MNIAILGYDVEGRDSYEYFAAQGHELTICDQNPAVVVPTGVAAVLGDAYLDNLDRFDLLVRTPGLSPLTILCHNPTVADKITTQLDEFMRVCPSHQIIGVTGTKGKGTTTTLIAKMLEAAGHRVSVGGNIGVAPLSLLPGLSATDWVVLEMSSFQLIDLRRSPPLAVCLMVVPEHLNWHQDMDNYVLAKSQLFAHQSAADTAIYLAGNDLSEQIAGASPGHKIPYGVPPGTSISNGTVTIDGQLICRTDELRLPGQHNWQNVCAAVTTVWQITQDVQALRSVLTTFRGLEHRIELVRELDGVRYYNDSYSSGLHATVAAIESIEGPKVVIVGGFDRMIDLDHFARFAREQAAEFRSLLLVGASAERLAATLRQAGVTNYVLGDDLRAMPAIVTKARSLAQTGDAVVLSPGFASFDMFKNFTERGLAFKAAVNQLTPDSKQGSDNHA